jgi:hypothetical protein
MKKTLVLLIVLMANLSIASEIWTDDPSVLPLMTEEGIGERYRMLGDFNGDGIEDMALSYDINLFGNGGGEFILYLQNKNKKYREYGKFLVHPYGDAVAIEKWGKETRLWTYSHGGGGIGDLRCYIVSGENLSDPEGLTIHPGDSGTGMGNAIYDAVFKNSNVKIKVQRSVRKEGKVQWE